MACILRHPPTMKTHKPFPHEKLHVYQRLLELVEQANLVTSRIPRGHRSLADHLSRAASNAALLVAEGANRRGAGEKRQRFVEARGECAEAAAVADVAQRLGFGSHVETDRLKQLAGESSAMLTALIARFAS